MSRNPSSTSPPGIGSRSASCPSDSDTAEGSRMFDQPASTAIQATAVATQTESRPTGAPNGIRR
jgi:hypothetical protein